MMKIEIKTDFTLTQTFMRCNNTRTQVKWWPNFVFNIMWQYVIGSHNGEKMCLIRSTHSQCQLFNNINSGFVHKCIFIFDSEPEEQK